MNETSTYEKIWIKTVSIAIGMMGFINIISAWFSYDSLRFKFIKNIFDYQLIHGSRYLVVMTGIVAILIAPSLYRQKNSLVYFNFTICRFWYCALYLFVSNSFANLLP